jgi:acyl carrier protein
MQQLNVDSLISEVAQRDLAAISKKTLLSDIDGWDSLKTVRLVLRLEDVLGRQLSEAELEQLQSVGEVERLLASAGA